jgi:uncharacterized membrane protein YdjX (TVP38/TMEM64 family)
MNLVRLLSGWWANPTLRQARFLLRRWWWIGACLGVGAIAWQLGPPLWQFLRDKRALEAFVQQLGWFGPLALIFFNALQIVVAPIPGYVLQAVAGYLFGPWWGGVWGALGLLAGSTLALWLSRAVGRRFVERWVGKESMARWEAATHSTNTWLWFLLLLAPTGDLPYFLAGLAGVSYIKILLLTLVIRIPSVFVVAAMGAGAVSAPWWQMAAILGLLEALLAFGLHNQERLAHWFDRRMQQWIS